MSTTTMDEIVPEEVQVKPGAQLAAVRLQKGYTTEYVAGKLHLRVKIIELLENDEYLQMPEPVFIKGYLRAYAKLLNVPSDPLLVIFERVYKVEPKTEKATLWQNGRETNGAERVIRWLTATFGLVVAIAVGMWWYSNQEMEQLFPKNPTLTQEEVPAAKVEPKIRLTDLSKMRSLLAPSDQMSVMEEEGG